MPDADLEPHVAVNLLIAAPLPLPALNAILSAPLPTRVALTLDAAAGVPIVTETPAEAGPAPEPVTAATVNVTVEPNANGPLTSVVVPWPVTSTAEPLEGVIKYPTRQPAGSGVTGAQLTTAPGKACAAADTCVGAVAVPVQPGPDTPTIAVPAVAEAALVDDAGAGHFSVTEHVIASVGTFVKPPTTIGLVAPVAECVPPDVEVQVAVKVAPAAPSPVNPTLTEVGPAGESLTPVGAGGSKYVLAVAMLPLVMPRYSSCTEQVI